MGLLAACSEEMPKKAFGRRVTDEFACLLVDV